jgi:hypothetical protein
MIQLVSRPKLRNSLAPCQFLSIYFGCWAARQYIRWTIARVEREKWTPEKLLIEWGARQNGRMTSAGPNKTTGGEVGTDEAEQAADYVESTCGFSQAKPILSWLYVKMRPIEAYIVRGPGEALPSALFRRGWGFALGLPPKSIPQAVLNGFIESLSARLIEEPFEIERFETDLALFPPLQQPEPKPKRKPVEMPAIDQRHQGHQTRLTRRA